jgi:hypothetical protein
MPKKKKDENKFQLNIDCINAANSLIALIPSGASKEKPYMQYILSRKPELGDTAAKKQNIRYFMQGRRPDKDILKLVNEIIAAETKKAKK